MLDDWIAAQGKAQFIVTILGRAISAGHLARVSAIIAEHGLNVDRVDRPLLGRRLPFLIWNARAPDHSHGGTCHGG